MTQEAKPRITITHERHEALLAAEARATEVEAHYMESLVKNAKACRDAIEAIGKLMMRLGRSQRAGRRLADIHKAKFARAKGNADLYLRFVDKNRAQAKQAEERAEALQVKLEEMSGLVMQGVQALQKVERERDAALKRTREVETKPNDPHARIVDTAKHADIAGIVEYGSKGTWKHGGVPNQEWHHVALIWDTDEEKKPALEDLFSGGGTVTAWVRWGFREKCYEARKLAEHWRDAWTELYGVKARELPWENTMPSRLIQDDEDRFDDARNCAEHYRDKCEEHCPTFAVFPWEKEDDSTAAE